VVLKILKKLDHNALPNCLKNIKSDKGEQTALLTEPLIWW